MYVCGFEYGFDGYTHVPLNDEIFAHVRIFVVVHERYAPVPQSSSIVLALSHSGSTLHTTSVLHPDDQNDLVVIVGALHNNSESVISCTASSQSFFSSLI